jgi:transaldolase
MEFFLDTGIVEEIKEAANWGIVNGVTTNPSLIAKSGRTQEDVIKEICSIVDGPVSAEVISTDKAGMLKEAEELAKINDNVVIKLPLTIDGISACKVLSDQNIKTNVTLCFSANQALLAAKNGATYISPFIGRLDDIGHSGMGLIEEIRVIYDNYGFPTQILAASVRHSDHVREAALVGADVATMPLSCMKSLFKHPLTDIGLEKFLADHQKSLQN